MSSIAIITARGGSKRIPHKNIKPFLGKPIIEYSIEAALNAGVFDEVMVSTDDEEIAHIAEACGAKVPFFRSKENSDDFSTTSDVIREVLKEYENRGQRFDYACCIYPTAPFLTAETIRDAMEILMDKKADSVVPVVKFSFPPQRAVVVRDGAIKMNMPEYALTRSQDLEPWYHDCGQFYCLNVESFLEQGFLVMDNTYPYYQDEMNVQDIDTVEDWEMAEMKMKLIRGSK